jgi:hypothetical protein
MIGEGWITRDTPWLVGETIMEGVANQAFRELEADGKHTWLHLADNDGYETAQPHFTGQGCIDYGRGSFFQERISAL